MKLPETIIIEKPLHERIFLWIWRGMKFLLVIFIIMAISSNPTEPIPDANGIVMQHTKSYGEGKSSSIAVIRLQGVISDQNFDGFSSPSNFANSDKIGELLEKVRKNSFIKAVILRVNTPGGEVLASQKIANHIKKTREEKPVYILMEASATSGGYYISAPATKIYAYPSTITGNIGVRLEFPKIKNLMENIGIEMQSLKSGRNKDMGSPFRNMSEEEREIFQNLIDESYESFVEEVVNGRKMKKEKALQLADGRIYSGKQAKENGLIDETVNSFSEFAQIIRSEINAEKIDIYEYYFYLSPFEEMLLGVQSWNQNPMTNFTNEMELRMQGPRLLVQ